MFRGRTTRHDRDARARVRFYLHRERFERELAEEMQFHVELKARDQERAGMNATDAGWGARRRFGNARRINDDTGDVMAVGWVEAAIQDARFTLRSLRQSPAFATVAVASLALGIGATTAIFTLATTLLVGAGLMVRSFQALLRTDIGFVPDHLIKLRLAGGDSVASTPERRAEVLARIAALPGMESAAATNCAPLEGDCALMPVTRVDSRSAERDEYPLVEVHTVSGDVLRTLRIPLRLGRQFAAREMQGVPTAVMLNESAARLLWKGASPIGRRISTFPSGRPSVEVIGVVADVKYEAIDAPVRPAVYYAAGQFSTSGGSIIVARSRGDAAASLPAIRRVIAESDPTSAIYGVATGDEMLARAASSTRFVTALSPGCWRRSFLPGEPRKSMLLSHSEIS